MARATASHSLLARTCSKRSSPSSRRKKGSRVESGTPSNEVRPSAANASRRATGSSFWDAMARLFDGLEERGQGDAPGLDLERSPVLEDGLGRRLHGDVGAAQQVVRVDDELEARRVQLFLGDAVVDGRDTDERHPPPRPGTLLPEA